MKLNVLIILLSRWVIYYALISFTKDYSENDSVFDDDFVWIW